MDLLNSILDFVQNHLPVAAGGLAVALEIVMRVLKTEKPKSLLLAAKAALEVAAVIVVKIGQVLSGLSSFLDKIIPQNLK